MHSPMHCCGTVNKAITVQTNDQSKPKSLLFQGIGNYKVI